MVAQRAMTAIGILSRSRRLGLVDASSFCQVVAMISETGWRRSESCRCEGFVHFVQGMTERRFRHSIDRTVGAPCVQAAG